MKAATEYFLMCLQTGASADEAYAKTVRAFDQESARAARAAIAKKTGQLYILRDPPIIVEHGMAEWYPGPQEHDVFWPALKTYLIKKGWGETVEVIDKSSSIVVSRLSPPGLAQIDTRGLVVGYVQSGKTANFTAVISKAADVNYRMFVVLSGLTNSLRNQTQARLEAELVALNTDRWLTLTQRNRDFNGAMPVNIDYALNPGPRILVVLKKNPRVLSRFIEWFAGGNESLRNNCPMLIIDDEADQASVNTSRNEEKRTAINRQIIALLGKGKKTAYVGYTATPFANVLNEPPKSDNLYPKSFILSLPRPKDYFGPERIFGRDRISGEEDDSEIDGVDVIREISEEEAQRLTDAATAFTPIVGSLEQAIRYYWMATAARKARAQPVAFSTMLVHTSLKTEVHEIFRGELVKFVNKFLARLKAGDQTLLRELRAQWNAEVSRMDQEKAGCILPQVQFDELWCHFGEVAEATKIVVDNHRSQDRLDFSEEKHGTNYLVVGGNTLSRGLTLEGLVVSYFRRTSTAYDTLLQMGRWFGYRKGYEDLPRVWMTGELRDYFLDLATVEEDFRREVKRYSLQKTPAHFGPRVRTNPKLSITSRLKMQAAKPCEMSYAGERPQTILFKHKDPAWLKRNIEATLRLFSTKIIGDKVRIGRDDPSKVSLYDMPVESILRFLQEYRFHEKNRELSNDLVCGYVRAQNALGNLLLWNVVLLGNKKAAERTFETDLGTVNMINRARMPTSDPESANIKALMSKVDIVADLDPRVSYAEMGEEELFQLRQATYPTNGLLLLYPIARDSKPKKAGGIRHPLNAVDDVIGLALVCPTPEHDTPQGYVTVDMSSVPREELDFDEDEELEDLAPA